MISTLYVKLLCEVKSAAAVTAIYHNLHSFWLHMSGLQSLAYKPAHIHQNWVRTGAMKTNKCVIFVPVRSTVRGYVHICDRRGGGWQKRRRERETDRDRQETRHAGYYSMCVLGLPRGQTIKEHLKRWQSSARKKGRGGEPRESKKFAGAWGACACFCMCPWDWACSRFSCEESIHICLRATEVLRRERKIYHKTSLENNLHNWQ